MSSDLLQQALIDATALKEVAIKNAENALIEKYSQEFNQTVKKLLEQEDPAMTETPPAELATPAPAATDPATTPASLDSTDMAAADPMAASDQVSKDVFSKVAGAFSGTDDNAVFEINFNQLEATLNEMLNLEERFDAGSSEAPIRDGLRDGGAGSMEVTEEELTDEMLSMSEEEPEEEEEIDLGSGEGEEGDIDSLNITLTPAGEGGEHEETSAELDAAPGHEETAGEEHTAVLATADDGGEEDEEEYEFELEEMVGTSEADKGLEAARENVGRAQKQLGDAQARLTQAELLAKQAAEKEAAAAKQTTPGEVQTESIEFSEEELEELAEELKVDIKVGNLSDGYMGSTETQKREQRNLELAAARDDKATAEREEEVEKLKDLMQENKDLKLMNNKLISVVDTMKLQLEKLNISNAKLVYTNKALVNISLNERQKNAIVESISKAGSVLEAKALYDTLQGAVAGLEKHEKAPQSLSEALNRAATPYVVKKSSANSINDLMAERMKALAGIKNKK